MISPRISGPGICIPLHDGSNVLSQVNVADQTAVQEFADAQMVRHGAEWAVSGFGEYRQEMFESIGHSQIISEKRFYHLGIDVWLPKGTEICIPLEGDMIDAFYDEGEGNYGGTAVFRHRSASDEIIYSVWGHLSPSSLPTKDSKLSRGDPIGRLAGMNENGGYFYHFHLQLLTQQAFESGWKSKAYATKEDWANRELWIYDPMVFLFL